MKNSINSTSFPRRAKIATVIAIVKNSHYNFEVSNFGSVIVLNCFSKIYETNIKNFLLSSIKGHLSPAFRDTKKVIALSMHWFHHWRYSNADLEICEYLCLHMKIMCWRFHTKTPFTFWDIRTCDIWKVCLQTFRNSRIC